MQAWWHLPNAVVRPAHFPICARCRCPPVMAFTFDRRAALVSQAIRFYGPNKQLRQDHVDGGAICHPLTRWRRHCRRGRELKGTRCREDIDNTFALFVATPGGPPTRSRPSSKMTKYVECWGADKPFANITDSKMAKNIGLAVGGLPLKYAPTNPFDQSYSPIIHNLTHFIITFIPFDWLAIEHCHDWIEFIAKRASLLWLQLLWAADRVAAAHNVVSQCRTRKHVPWTARSAFSLRSAVRLHHVHIDGPVADYRHTKVMLSPLPSSPLITYRLWEFSLHNP